MTEPGTRNPAPGGLRVAVILPAAGTGSRFAAGHDYHGSKIEYPLAGKAVFLRSVDLFARRKDVSQMVLAVAPDEVEAFRFKWEAQLAAFGVQIVPGGKAERWETVQRAIDAVGEDATHIAVHDAARPLATQTMIDRVFAAAERLAAVIPGVAVSDTLKRVEDMTEAEPGMTDGSDDPADAILGVETAPGADAQVIVETVPRAGLVGVQTPQVFEAGLLRRAYAALAGGELDATAGGGVTDDAALVEAIGQRVFVVEGERTNMKLTRAEDLEVMAALAEKRDAAAARTNAAKRLFLHDDEDD